MQKFQDTVTTRVGGGPLRPVSGASVLVKTLAGVTATIYSDNGVTPVSNPLTTDSNGYFSFYAADGRYTLTISGAGISPRTVQDVLLEDPADEDADISELKSGKASFSQFATYAAVVLPAAPSLILVLADETNGGARTLYYYDGSQLNWLPTVGV